VAEAFLAGAAEALQTIEGAAGTTVYPPVPPPVARVAGVERMQMLIESGSRVALQRLLAGGLPRLHEVRARHRVLRWAVDVDPLAI
jgi:primosomal protein N' (replication factor Y)